MYIFNRNLLLLHFTFLQYRKKMKGQIVLITGGAGFLGQHLVKEFQNSEEEISEIRVLDIHPYYNKLGHPERIPVKSFVGDIVTMNTDCAEAFSDVSTVFHCAAYVSYEFPSDFQKLQANNVQGTKNVIELCLMNKVSTLIYTSTAEICMKPYFRNAFFSVIINQSEAKIPPPNDPKQLIFGGYAESKLMAEQLILKADNQKHFSGNGKLRTTALRPTFMYGEEDKFLIPTILKISKKLNNQIWRIGGSGGRHQFVYVGNVAWAHICAKRVLEESANSIGGLPIFVTDDTNITDLLYFSKNLCHSKDKLSKPVTTTSWYIPVILSYFLFLIFETIYKYLNNVFTLPKLPVSPKSFVIYLGSVIFFSRLRAIISLDYIPIYKQDEAYFRSKLFYNNLLQNECNKTNKELIK